MATVTDYEFEKLLDEEEEIVRRSYTTESSGARVEYSSGMVRDSDDGKPRFDLLIADGVPYEDQLLTRCAALMARGAALYGDKNWAQADSMDEIDRMKASALRHVMQWVCGEDDEDHAAAVVANLFMAESTLYKLSQL